MSEKTVAQKLLIKPGMRALFVNPPQGYAEILGDLPDHLVMVGSDGVADFIQVFVNTGKELEEKLPELRSRLDPKGLLWVTYHKGTSKVKTDIHRDIIAAYAQSIGFQPVAMIAVNDDWSALRLKII